MGLRQIDLRTAFKHRFAKAFNEEGWSVSELYWSRLRDYPTGKVKKCSIHVSDNWGEREFYYSSYPDFKGINLSINFTDYFKVEKLMRKNIQLELLHKGMLLIADYENWSTDPLIDAYNYCLNEKLKYNFFVRNKLKSSPNRKRKAGLFCDWDIDFFKLFWVLFDKNGIEIRREILTSLERSRGEMAYYMTWKWLDDQTICIQDKTRPKNTWTVNLADFGDIE